jgi:hypothetical protein
LYISNESDLSCHFGFFGFFYWQKYLIQNIGLLKADNKYICLIKFASRRCLYLKLLIIKDTMKVMLDNSKNYEINCNSYIFGTFKVSIKDNMIFVLNYWSGEIHKLLVN